MALNPHAVIHHASNPFHLGIVPPASVIVLSIGGIKGRGLNATYIFLKISPKRQIVHKLAPKL